MTETFNLHVTLTGLMMFVPNKEDKSAARMCALLVDGRKSKKALDEKFLTPHRGFIRFPVDNHLKLPEGAEEHVGLWYLKRQRLIFRVTEKPTPEGKSPNPFRVDMLRLADGEQHPIQPADGQQGSFTWVLDMTKVFPHFDIDLRLLGPTPPEDSVLAQVVFDRGRLRTQKLAPVVWEYDTTLSDKPFKQKFAHEVAFMMQDLTSAELLVVDFDDPKKTMPVDLGQFQKNGTVNIDIVNVCERNPLQWSVPTKIEADVDSRWFFQLMPEALKTKAKEILASKGVDFLPVPRPIRERNEDEDLDSPGAPGSGNCLKAQSRAVPYQVEELDKA